jgi:hypothetical protein
VCRTRVDIKFLVIGRHACPCASSDRSTSHHLDKEEAMQRRPNVWTSYKVPSSAVNTAATTIPYQSCTSPHLPYLTPLLTCISNSLNLALNPAISPTLSLIKAT